MRTPIIALGRQFGSGGREVGKRLAEKLQVRCYDRELITLAAQKAEVREELFAGREEKAPNPWLFTGIYEGGPQVRKGQPAEDILFEMQSRVIWNLLRWVPASSWGGAPMSFSAPPASRRSACSSAPPLRTGSNAEWR